MAEGLPGSRKRSSLERTKVALVESFVWVGRDEASLQRRDNDITAAQISVDKCGNMAKRVRSEFGILHALLGDVDGDKRLSEASMLDASP